MFYGCTSLTSVTIPDSAISIGNNAFYNCSSLISVNIGNGVKSISNSAFSVCYKLESINISEDNTIYSSVDGVLFDKEKLTIIKYPSNKSDISNYEIPSTVKIIENGAFYNCKSIANVTIGNNVTSIGSDAFNGCTSLTNMTIPDSVTSMGDSAFYYCTNLTSVTIGNNVTSIGSDAFHGCTSLTNMTIPDSVTSMGDSAFYYCTNLTSVTIGNNVTSIGSNAFYGCTLLTNMTIPDSVTSIGSNAFYGCTSLTNVTIGNGVNNIESNAFYGCNNIRDIYIDKIQSEVTFGNSWKSTGDVHYSDCTHSLTNKIQSETLSIVPTENSDNTNNEKISCRGTYRFKVVDSSGKTVKDKLVKITQQETAYSSSTRTVWISPDQEGIYTIENIVRNVSIEEIGELSNGKTLQDIDENGITWNYIYQNGRAKNIYYEKGHISSEVKIPSELGGYKVISCKENMFWYALGNRNIINAIIVPESIESINKSVFSNCGSLESINVSESNGNYSSANGILYNKEQTEIIYVPKTIKNISIPNTVISIGDYTFKDCNRLTTVTIPDSVSSIGNNVFYNCSNLESINVSESNGNYSSANGILYNKEQTEIIYVPKTIKNISIPNTVISIGDYTFKDCNRLTTVTIPDSVSSIGNNVFYNCSNLKTVAIGKGVTTIGENAFSNCSNLESINVSELNNAYSSINGILYDKQQTSILIVPDKINGEIIIPESVFSIQTEHNYLNKISRTYVKTVKGATSLTLTFDANCYLESDYDYVIISDKNGIDIYNSKGQGNKALANKEITVEGDTVKIYFHTDSSVVYWGFKCLVKASNTK